MGARSVVQAVFFGLSNHVVEGCVGDGILPVAILEHIDEPHSPVGSNLSKWNLSCFEELDDEWAAYVEEVCSFCSSDLGTKCRDADAISGVKLLHNQQ